jgi:hypothetical protein
MVEKSGNPFRGKRSLTSSAATGVLWTLVGTGGQTVLKFIVLMVLARILTPTEFGTVGAALVVITLMGIFAQLGVAQALIQLPEQDRDHLVAGFHNSLSWCRTSQCAVSHGGPDSPYSGDVARLGHHWNPSSI